MLASSVLKKVATIIFTGVSTPAVSAATKKIGGDAYLSDWIVKIIDWLASITEYEIFQPVAFTSLGTMVGYIGLILATRLDRRQIARQPMRRRAPLPLKPASKAAKLDFRDAHRLYPALGEPTSEVFRCNMYVAAHRSALIVWLDHLNEFLVFRHGSTSRTVKRYPDLTWDDRPELSNDNAMRELLGMKAGETPPYSGVAKMWLAAPNEWSWIGSRLWHRNFTGDLAFCQRFDNGILFGVVPMGPESEAGNIYVVLGEDTLHLHQASFIPEKGTEPKTA